MKPLLFTASAIALMMGTAAREPKTSAGIWTDGSTNDYDNWASGELRTNMGTRAQKCVLGAGPHSQADVRHHTSTSRRPNAVSPCGNVGIEV